MPVELPFPHGILFQKIFVLENILLSIVSSKQQFLNPFWESIFFRSTPCPLILLPKRSFSLPPPQFPPFFPLLFPHPPSPPPFRPLHPFPVPSHSCSVGSLPFMSIHQHLGPSQLTTRNMSSTQTVHRFHPAPAASHQNSKRLLKNSSGSWNVWASFSGHLPHGHPPFTWYRNRTAHFAHVVIIAV